MGRSAPSSVDSRHHKQTFFSQQVPPMKRLLTVFGMLLSLGGVPAAHAQLDDAKGPTLQTPKAIRAAAEAEARKNNWSLSIAVVDAHGELLAFERMDDAALTTIAIAQGK